MFEVTFTTFVEKRWFGCTWRQFCMVAKEPHLVRCVHGAPIATIAQLDVYLLKNSQSGKKVLLLHDAFENRVLTGERVG